MAPSSAHRWLHLVRWALLLALGVPFAGVGCAAQPASNDEYAACELEPQKVSQSLSGDGESVSSTAEALSAYSCKMSGATGYKSGQSFDIEVVTIDGKKVEWKTANAYMRMAEAAAKSGVQIRVVSGFRTMAEQQYLYHCYTSCSCNGCNLAAVPGTSNHQSGHALDLNTSAGGVYSWLESHAKKFGFERTVPGEAWHWEWWGTDDGTGPCNADTLRAKLTKRWSNEKRFHGKKADYIACAGDKVKLSFTFANQGTAPWRDVDGRGSKVGSDVFLVTANGKKDVITGKKRFSVRLDANPYVRGDKKGKNCSNAKGCKRTTFIHGAIAGKAPNNPGLYKSRWRLRDYSKVWGKKSKGFGPKAEIALEVVSCQQSKQECGCRVWCSDGTSQKLAASIATAAECKSVAETYCKPQTAVDHSFQACSAPPSSGSGGSSGASGAGGASEPSSAPDDAASGDPASGDPASGDPATSDPASGDAPATDDGADVGNEDEPNSLTPADERLDDAVGTEEPDDADFVDDGYPGYDAQTEATPSGASSGCSVATPGTSHGPASLFAGLTALGALLVVRRRRSRRTLRPRALAALGLLGLLASVAVGCSSEQGESAHAGYDLGQADEPLSLHCGADKYSSVQGADVSSWQGSFDWSAQRKAGMDFGFARISDGLGYVDPTFAENWKKMKAAGILRGAYQYFEPGQSAKDQADMMVKKVGKLGSGDLPCVIDVETSGGQSPGTIASKVKTWLDIVEKGTGKKPIIYTGAYFWEASVKSTSFGGYDLWIAAYGPSCPSLPKGWKNWTIWQYCDGNKQYCKNGAGFDRNVFNGQKDALTKLAAGDKTLKAKALKKWSNVKRYHGKKADYIACAGQDVKMSFTFSNTGSAVWHDVDGRGSSVGSDVFMVTANGKKDTITKKTRFSVNLNANRYVHGDRKAKNCSNANGCRKTTFIQGAIHGTAPKQPGVYHSRWRLRDYSKVWGKHSHGFGPKVDLALEVVSCQMPAQSCGCRVWCSNGQHHDLEASIASDAACKSVGETYCKPAALVSHTFQACAAPPTPPSPPPGADQGSAGAGGSDPGTAPDLGSGGQSGAGAGAGGDTSSPSADVQSSGDGSEDDPNAISIADDSTASTDGTDGTDGTDDSDVPDDPDFTEDGFTGDDTPSADSGASAGCSFTSGSANARGPAPLATGGILVLFALAAARRRSSRRTGSRS